MPIPAFAPAVRLLFPVSPLEANEEEEDEAELEKVVVMERLDEALLDVVTCITVSLVVVDDSVVEPAVEWVANKLAEIVDTTTVTVVEALTDGGGELVSPSPLMEK
jgi:hypothetical protein